MARTMEIAAATAESAVHIHSFKFHVQFEPECERDGFTVYFCECGESYISRIQARGHVFTEEIVMPASDVQGHTLHVCFCGYSYTDNYFTQADWEYADYVSNMGIFDSTVSQAMPQTVVHKLVMDHFSSDSPGIKKAIVIGYDGFRADALAEIMDMQNSAVMYLKEKGGLYHTFSGGVRGVNEQLTESGPSWVTITTGGWGGYHGAIEQFSTKNGAKTFLTELAELGYAGSFTVSYPEHLEYIFKSDLEYAQINSLPIEYTCQSNDDATNEKILEYVTKNDGDEKTAQEDPDVIFYTLEDVDMAGHTRVYGSAIYKGACRVMDKEAYDIIQAIESRSTYEQEDWLIIITTDHGGSGHTHGEQSYVERMTWLACNKPIDITEEHLNYAQE